ncbi:MAG: fasciclin domain-containing protein [Chitinophagaceae bacterium]
MNIKTILPAFVVLLLLTGICISGCKKQVIKLTTTEDVNIVGYLEKNLDSFSLFKQILDRTETSAFLNAYGAYTCFAPTNSGVKLWLATTGTASVEAADLNTLKDLVKFHLLSDTVTTAAFKDGKLPVPTMLGQYLITGVSNQNSSSSYTVNRQALVTKSNIKTGNGIIQQIDHVLVPAALTIAKQLEAKPEFSIFTEALKATGYYTVLNTVNPDTAIRWMTVMAETNQALADSGFTSFNALKTRYSKTGDPASVNDSLHIYVAYHILSGIKFLGDIITAPAHPTFQPQEVLTTQLINEDVVLNENEFNGILEKGVHLNRVSSDNAATNGVWHTARAHFIAKYRKPTALYWDVSTFPEVLKLPAIYKKASTSWTRQSESDQPLKEITWGWGSLAGTNVFEYVFSTTASTSIYSCNNDFNKLPLGLPSRPTWWEMTTPPVIKGRYKVWLCYTQSKQSSSSNMLCEVRVNGELMQRTMNFTVSRPSGTDAELEAIGWKRYTESNANTAYSGRLVGTVEFKTTQRQTIRISAISGTQNNNYLDMVHIIPVDEDQVLPRFRPDGTKVFQ